MLLQLLPVTRRIAGAGQTPRKYCDFVVDGCSVLSSIGWIGADLITPLGWGVPEHQKHVVAELLRKAPASLPSGRTPIYICPECGDIGCGAIAVRIGRAGDQIMWSDFASENGYEAPREIAADTMRFDPRDYWKAIATFGS
jgi:hypothetical protein